MTEDTQAVSWNDAYKGTAIDFQVADGPLIIVSPEGNITLTARLIRMAYKAITQGRGEDIEFASASLATKGIVQGVADADLAVSANTGLPATDWID